jgi:hypothetical protein
MSLSAKVAPDGSVPHATNPAVAMGTTPRGAAYDSVKALVSDPVLTATPGAGPVGTLVTFSGSGFAPSSAATVTLTAVSPYSDPSFAGMIACSNTTSPTGNFTCQYEIPKLSSGTQTFKATDTSSDSAGVYFNVDTLLTVYPKSGGPGTLVEFNGSGFAGQDGVFRNEYSVTWADGAACPASNANYTGDGTFDWGTFTCRYTIPTGTGNGSYRFEAQDAVGFTASGTFIVGPTYSVTFKAQGLPGGSTWSVAAGSPPSSQSDTTVGSTGLIVFHEATGLLSFSITPPAGYGVVSVTGPHGTTFGTAPITAKTTITVKFGALNTVTFTESVIAHWPGLPAGAAWNVTLTPSAHGGPPGQYASTTGTTITFTAPHGAAYKFVVGKPSTYKASGGKGSFTMPDPPLGKTVKFQPFTAKLTFTEHGLAAHTVWSVTVTGTPAGPAPYTCPCVASSGNASQVFNLVNGTYSFTVPVVGADHPTPASGGPLTIVAPHGQTQVIVFAPEHAPFGSNPVSRESGTLLGHTNLVATVSGREAA